jgi:hypothetical protein
LYVIRPGLANVPRDRMPCADVYKGANHQDNEIRSWPRDCAAPCAVGRVISHTVSTTIPACCLYAGRLVRVGFVAVTVACIETLAIRTGLPRSSCITSGR